MSLPHDPYQRPERALDPQYDRAAGHPAVAAPVVPAPIVWKRTGGAVSQHPWAAPDPFATPQERPAPPIPVTRSQVPAPLTSAPVAPELEVAPVQQPPIQQPQVDERRSTVAFPDPVPAPPSQPRREPAAPAPAPPAPAAQGPDPVDAASDVDEEEALTIGRGRGNSIVLDDMLVSRHHVRITADDDGLVLQDLGSRNGTYVNGERVERTSLHEGDRLGIGGTTFEVRDGWLVSV